MKDKFLTSTLLLLIGGFLTKVLGMIIKIEMARSLGTEGLGLYMLVLPTFMLLINLSQLGLPLALSKLISENTKSSKKLFFSVLPIILIVNIFLIGLTNIFGPIISMKLLHKEETYLSIIAISFVLPFTSISSITRSYFYGKQKMLPHVISNITEDFVRLIIIKTTIQYILPYGLQISVAYLIIINIISELTSTIVLLVFLPKNVQITKEDIRPNKTYQKESLSIGIPTTASRLIGSIAFFLEPIILTNGLLNAGYSSNYITKEYGIISGYVLPLILLPSFFTSAISQALLPVLTKEAVNNNKEGIKRKLYKAIILTIIITIPITILLEIKPNLFLKLIYHTTEGVKYIKVLAPICLLEYLEYSLSTTLDSLGKSKENMKASLYGMITRTSSLWLLTHFKIGLWSLILSISINILITVFYQIKKVRESLT